MNRKERYKQNRKFKEKLGITQTRCKDCGCYTKGRHKVWCKSKEAEQKQDIKDGLIGGLIGGLIYEYYS